MTREEAIKIINCYDIGFYDLSGEKIPADKLAEAMDKATEALSAGALLKQEIDFHKEVSRIEAEKVVDLEHKLADMVSVVRCKDCKNYSVEGETTQFGWCNALEMPTDEQSFCSYGERREPNE